jgi:predicted nucleotidyltransferase
MLRQETDTESIRRGTIHIHVISNPQDSYVPQPFLESSKRIDECVYTNVAKTLFGSLDKVQNPA